MTIDKVFVIISLAVADVAHLVERHLAKVEVASSSLVIRSKKKLLSYRQKLFSFKYVFITNNQKQPMNFIG